jgi:Sel1 repeat
MPQVTGQPLRLEGRLSVNRYISFRILIMAIVTMGLIALGMNWHMKNEVEIAPITGAANYNLTDGELVTVTDAAQRGDDEAALRLANYYSIVKQDNAVAITWLRKAAAHEYKNSEYNLGFLLLLGDSKLDKAEGIFWLERAEKKGDLLAKNFLSEYHKEVPP